MGEIYFEDVVIGYVEETSEAIVDGVEMVRYAEQHDPHAMHVDEEFARTSPYGGLVASFGYTVSLFLRLIHSMDYVRKTTPVFLGAIEWRVQFHGAVRANDRLHVRLTITDKRLSSRGGRGVVTSHYEIVNQHGASVITIEALILLPTAEQDQL